MPNIKDKKGYPTIKLYSHWPTWCSFFYMHSHFTPYTHISFNLFLLSLLVYLFSVTSIFSLKPILETRTPEPIKNIPELRIWRRYKKPEKLLKRESSIIHTRWCSGMGSWRLQLLTSFVHQALSHGCNDWACMLLLPVTAWDGASRLHHLHVVYSIYVVL